MALNKTLVQKNRAVNCNDGKSNFDYNKHLRLLISVYELTLPSRDKSSIGHVKMKENVKWTDSSPDNLKGLTTQVLESWARFGEPEHTIEGETKFCEPQILQQILNAKSVLEQFNRSRIKAARGKCNPYEKVKSSIFQNRSAVKIANMDVSLDFMFTDPRDENGKSLIDDLLYFADVCAGPGGFSEYILWRKKWMAKGFGFTLKSDSEYNENLDLNLSAFKAGTTETYQIFYGATGDGNILNPENIVSLNNYIRNQTSGKGVHFMMGDGGIFIPPREKNSEEIICRQLYLCQCLAALFVVREGGNFVVKLFDTFTLFSAGLVFLIYKCFKQITIMKPKASRPGCSERYLIGRFKKPNTQTITEHLLNINVQIWNNGTNCIQIVPYEIMKKDHQFFNYLYASNNEIGRNQITILREIAEICKDSRRVPFCNRFKEQIRRLCVEVWKLPEKKIKNNEFISADECFKKIIGDWFDIKGFMLCPDKELSDLLDIHRIFRGESDWYFVPVDTFQKEPQCMRTFFMSCGGYNVYYFSSIGEWKQLKNVAVEMSNETLIYGDLVTEMNDDQTPSVTLQIIDGIVLGGVDIRHAPLHERSEMCRRFANSLNKPVKSIDIAGEVVLTSSISYKKLHRVNEFTAFLNTLSRYTVEDCTNTLAIKVYNFLNKSRWYVPGGLLFLNEVKPNLEKVFSKTCHKWYYDDQATGKTFFLDSLRDPKSIFASFKTTFTNRYLWKGSQRHKCNI